MWNQDENARDYLAHFLKRVENSHPGPSPPLLYMGAGWVSGGVGWGKASRTHQTLWGPETKASR